METYCKSFNKHSKLLAFIGLGFIFISLLIPNKETMVGMVAAKAITPNAIEEVKSTTKDAVDYLFEKINFIIDNKEEE